MSCMPLRQSLAGLIVNLLAWAVFVVSMVLIYREAEP